MLLVMVGGALGTLLRYWLGTWLNAGRTFPLGTFVVNVTGSFILAGAFVLLMEKLRPGLDDWYLLIGTGFCGGYTTFSTFEVETFRMVRDGLWGHVFLYVFGSILAAFLGVLLAVGLVNLFFPEP
jgi:CrcB protein